MWGFWEMGPGFPSFPVSWFLLVFIGFYWFLLVFEVQKPVETKMQVYWCTAPPVTSINSHQHEIVPSLEAPACKLGDEPQGIQRKRPKKADSDGVSREFLFFSFRSTFFFCCNNYFLDITLNFNRDTTKKKGLTWRRRMTSLVSFSFFLSHYILFSLIIFLYYLNDNERRGIFFFLFLAPFSFYPQAGMFSLCFTDYYYQLLYASTRVRFYIVLRHSRHLSVTTVSSSYLPFVIVYLRLFVFRPSSFSSLRIYSAPIMFRASFLGFVAGLSYCNISTFLWLDN